MSNTDESSPSARTPWHQFLALVFEWSIGAEGVTVQSEVQISSEPPRIDVLLLRRESTVWTPEQLKMVPDGLRESSASDILIEFKYSESLALDTILQALGYEYFYRTSRGLKKGNTQIFVLCARTPQSERLAELEYVESDVKGVYISRSIYAAHVPLILLNEIEDAPHNAFVKAFASRKRQKTAAFRTLREFGNLSTKLLSMFEVLRVIEALPEDVKMTELLTPERVLEFTEELRKALLTHLPVDELETYIAAEYNERLKKQGIKSERIDTIIKLLDRRFDVASDDVRDKLADYTLDQLDDLIDPALDAPDLDAFFAHLPKAETVSTEKQNNDDIDPEPQA